jgi:hypothetical protein
MRELIMDFFELIIYVIAWIITVLFAGLIAFITTLLLLTMFGAILKYLIL